MGGTLTRRADTAQPRRVLLVGFMGSGKSTVGRRLSSLLRWRFLDMDREIERADGRSVPEIFGTDGEARFRELEALAADRLLRREGVVIAAGGGWACRPGRLEALDPQTLSIWLRVTPETAVARTAGSPIRRPLFEVDDPLARARELLRSREPFYRMASWKVDTDGRSVSEVARELAERIEALGRGRPGEPPGPRGGPPPRRSGGDPPGR